MSVKFQKVLLFRLCCGKKLPQLSQTGLKREFFMKFPIPGVQVVMESGQIVAGQPPVPDIRQGRLVVEKFFSVLPVAKGGGNKAKSFFTQFIQNILRR